MQKLTANISLETKIMKQKDNEKTTDKITEMMATHGNYIQIYRDSSSKETHGKTAIGTGYYISKVQEALNSGTRLSSILISSCAFGRNCVHKEALNSHLTDDT